MVHVASPMILEGRGSSRAGSMQIQSDSSIRSRSEHNSSPMMVQAQSPHRSARESQHYLMSVERNGQNLQRSQYPEASSTATSLLSHSNIMKRNAIAQQLVQQSLTNKAQYQMMNQNNPHQLIPQQVTGHHGQHAPQGHQTLPYPHTRPTSGSSMHQITNSAYSNSQTMPKNSTQTLTSSQISMQRTSSNQNVVNNTIAHNQHTHQTLPSRNSPQMINRLTQNSAQITSRQLPYNEQIASQRPQIQSSQQTINSTQALQKAWSSLQASKARAAAKPPPQEQERTYMNVQPIAVIGRNGRVMKPSEVTEIPADETKKTQPTIPKSQEVKHKQEPLYSTILQLPSDSSQSSFPKYQNGQMQPPPMFEDTAMYANYAPASLYSNYSNYSELDVLRSSDSHCSAEEEHTEGLPNLGDSPVSSSYSELRQAHGLVGNPLQQLQFAYNMDGIYEPVLPPKGGILQQKHFKSLSNSSSDSDYFGTCVKCNERIVGEGSGCSAMGRLYHILCFTCSVCNCHLQGLPFYSVDGNPLCQADYKNTLEKCCKCFSPILDRILRATGKPYHPDCFSCVVCSKSLDGIPFTVDAANQIHCIEDFHRRFAPRCSVCHQPIMPTPGQEETVRVVALDRSFHIDCYRCVDCNLLLSSEEEGRGCYPLDNDVLCKQCNTRRIQALTSRITPD